MKRIKFALALCGMLCAGSAGFSLGLLTGGDVGGSLAPYQTPYFSGTAGSFETAAFFAVEPFQNFPLCFEADLQFNYLGTAIKGKDVRLAVITPHIGIGYEFTFKAVNPFIGFGLGANFNRMLPTTTFPLASTDVSFALVFKSGVRYYFPQVRGLFIFGQVRYNLNMPKVSFGESGKTVGAVWVDGYRYNDYLHIGTLGISVGLGYRIR